MHDLIPPLMKAKGVFPFYRLLLFGFLCAQAGAAQSPSLSGPVIWSDDLESGSGNWTVYPGSPICTSLEYVSTATDLNGNHTVGGSYGFKLVHASNRVYRDVDLSAYVGASMKLSLWFYDVLDTRPYSFEPFDLRDAANKQILGLGAWAYGSQDQYYQCRVLTAANGAAGPNWVATSVARSVGWHHFEIVQYRGGTSSNTVEFYIDGALGLRNTNVFDVTLNRIVLGLGWTYNEYQAGYVDDISLEVVPEPGSLGLLGLGLIVLRLSTRSRTS